jgi:hypothetical protein
MNLMQQGVIRSRQDVVTQLESYGLTVARETKSSISIADPDGGRNIRLKGMIYERDFKFGEGLRGEIEAAGAGYRAEREARVREAGDVYQRGTAIKLAEHQQRYPRAERQADGHDQNLRLNGDGVDIPLLRPADRHPGRDNLVSGHDHHPRLSEMDSYSQQLASLKAKSGAGVTIYSDDTRRNTYLVVLPKQARRGNLHVDDRQHRGEIHGEITPSERPETPQRVFNEDDQNHDRDGKTASERLRELTDKLRATAAGVAGQLQQFAAHVRGYLTGADAQRPGVSALEQSGGQLARAGRELEQERQPLDALIRQHDRAYAEKLREQQPEPEPQKRSTRYYGPSM